jgi:hypothetical protein
MWHKRKFSFASEPYPRFVAEAVWSVVMVAVVAVSLLYFGVHPLIAAGVASMVAAGLGQLLYNRVVAERTRLIRAANPRMATLMARYGVMPRTRRPAGLGA